MSQTEVERDDAELVSLCLAGSQDAFNGLVSRHHRQIYNMVYRMVGNPEDAADCTQDAFLRAYERLHTFQLDRSFLAWLRAPVSSRERCREASSRCSRWRGHLQSTRSCC